jgi:aspartyl-tRNA(Asn)/glutamyl-tRNA(Gln) amidotransferase subunit A
MYHNFAEVKIALSSGKSVLDIVEDYLHNIEQNKDLNSFLEVFEDSVRQQAAAVDLKIKSGNAGKLAGLVVGIKDNICFKGHKVSASSKILDGFESLYTATALQRLIDEDAVVIGRLNCDEFAMGASNETSAYGPVLNAADKKRVSGGSSGGAAVSVQAEMCLASLGSDTGGSIRQPASFCGLVGYKPTYGRVSRWGLIAYASSFDIIGPITHSVSDAQLIMEVIAGEDENDATSSAKPVGDYVSKEISGKKKFAYIQETYDAEGIDPEVKARAFEFLEKVKSLGHEVEAISFPYLNYMIPVYYTLTTAEASSNLSRFAGMHYGHRTSDAKDLDSLIKKSRSEGFGAEVKRRIMLGTFVLSSGYYDAYYSKAQKVRRLVQNKTEELFKDYDFIISPTSPSVAFEVGAKASNPIAMYLADIFTVHANIAGNPAVSIPFGNNSENLPIGMQLMGRRFEDADLLAISKSLS